MGLRIEDSSTKFVFSLRLLGVAMYTKLLQCRSACDQNGIAARVMMFDGRLKTFLVRAPYRCSTSLSRSSSVRMKATCRKEQTRRTSLGRHLTAIKEHHFSKTIACGISLTQFAYQSCPRRSPCYDRRVKEMNNSRSL